jgi:hypothetical protein
VPTIWVDASASLRFFKKVVEPIYTHARKAREHPPPPPLRGSARIKNPEQRPALAGPAPGKQARYRAAHRCASPRPLCRGNSHLGGGGATKQPGAIARPGAH